jgi:hypothetical protein
MLTLFAQCTNAWAGFHSSTGWIGFIAVALSMVAVTRRMPFFAVRQSEVDAEAREGDPTAAYLAFFFVVVRSVRRPARTLAGRDCGGDVLCLGNVPTRQGRGCHTGPCHDERPDRRGGSFVRKLELVVLTGTASRGFVIRETGGRRLPEMESACPLFSLWESAAYRADWTAVA